MAEVGDESFRVLRQLVGGVPLLKVRVVPIQLDHGGFGVCERGRAGELLRPVQDLGWYADILQRPLGEAVEVRGEDDTHGTPGNQPRDRTVRGTGYLQALL